MSIDGDARVHFQGLAMYVASISSTREPLPRIRTGRAPHSKKPQQANLLRLFAAGSKTN